MSIVEDTEQTQFCPQMDRRTDRQTDAQMDRRTRWNQYTTLSTSLIRGYNKLIPRDVLTILDLICYVIPLKMLFNIPTGQKSD